MTRTRSDLNPGRHRWGIFGSSVVLLLALAGCSLTPQPIAPAPSTAPSASDPTVLTTSPPAVPASAPAAPSSAPVPPSPAASERPFATRPGSLDGTAVEALVYPVHRRGHTSVVNVLFRSVEQDGVFLLGTELNDGDVKLGDRRHTTPDALRLIDGKSGKAYLPATVDGGYCLCSPQRVATLIPDRERQLWVSVTFAAPPATVATVDVLIPHFGTVPDVPVV